MDLTTLRLEVRERLAELTADFFTVVEVDRAINEAIRRFASEERWPWLLTEWTDGIPVDEDTLDLPDNVSFTRTFNLSVSGGSLAFSRSLERVAPEEGFKLRHAYELQSSSPRWYYIGSSSNDGSALRYTARVIPTPDDDYDVEAQYYRVPDDLVNITDEPDMPEEYQEAVAAWAAGKLFLKELQVSQKASEQFSIYYKVLEQAKADTQSLDMDERLIWGGEPVSERVRPTLFERIAATLGP